MATTERFRNPWFVKQDIDGFFGLMIDNLVQLLLIAGLTSALCGFSAQMIYGKILPASALSVIVGNIFYTLQARWVARREKRTDVTALPYGINTPSVIAYIIFVMAPVFQEFKGKEGYTPETAADLAWRIGLLACIGSGLIEFFGSLAAPLIRKVTPRAGLIASLAGIAIGFISMDFIMQVFSHPIIALIPLGILLIQYFSGARLPLGIPAGLAALIAGTALGWGVKGFLTYVDPQHVPDLVQKALALEITGLPKDFAAFKEALKPAVDLQGMFAFATLGDLNHWKSVLPQPVIDVIQRTVENDLQIALKYLFVIIPMGVFNLIGSLQNIESAEAAGDKFSTIPSLMVNGLGTLMAAAFGSCFPTTIYIGHAGWKHLGARSGYSLMNGVVIAILCLLGLVKSIGAVVPLEAVVGILLWIALVIIGQAFQSVPRRHAPAVALGLIPGLAAWGLILVQNVLMTAYNVNNLTDLGPEALNNLYTRAHLGGLIALHRGFILTSMGLASMGVFIIERRFKAAAFWALALGVLSFFGVIHAWNPLDPGFEFYTGIGTGWNFAFGYLVIAGVLMIVNRNAENVSDGMLEAHGLASSDPSEEETPRPAGRLAGAVAQPMMPAASPFVEPEIQVRIPAAHPLPTEATPSQPIPPARVQSALGAPASAIPPAPVAPVAPPPPVREPVIVARVPSAPPEAAPETVAPTAPQPPRVMPTAPPVAPPQAAAIPAPPRPPAPAAPVPPPAPVVAPAPAPEVKKADAPRPLPPAEPTKPTVPPTVVPPVAPAAPQPAPVRVAPPPAAAPTSPAPASPAAGPAGPAPAGPAPLRPETIAVKPVAPSPVAPQPTAPVAPPPPPRPAPPSSVAAPSSTASSPSASEPKPAAAIPMSERPTPVPPTSADGPSSAAPTSAPAQPAPAPRPAAPPPPPPPPTPPAPQSGPAPATGNPFAPPPAPPRPSILGAPTVPKPAPPPPPPPVIAVAEPAKPDAAKIATVFPRPASPPPVAPPPPPPPPATKPDAPKDDPPPLFLE